jgi:hypothetical protein
MITTQQLCGHIKMVYNNVQTKIRSATQTIHLKEDEVASTSV